MFDWEYGIALHAMQGNRASFPSEGDVSYDFSSCSENLGYICELQRGWPLEIPISLWKLERDPWSSTSPPEVSILSCQAHLDSLVVPHNYTGFLTSLNKVDFRIAIPAVTCEYTPGSCRNSRNRMRHPPCLEMRLDSPALHAEQSRIPNKRRKSFDFLDGTPESPGKLSQNEMNTDAHQECKIARCTPNQLKMKPISASLAPYLSRVSQHTVQVA